MPDIADPRAFLERLFYAAVAAADPDKALAAHLPEKPKGRTVVVGAGKGAAQMARAFERLWDAPLSGVVVTRYGYAVPCERIEVLEAAHPVPDESGLHASDRLMAAVGGLTEDDLVVALICGGGSALLPAPAGDLTLADEIAVNRALLASGAPIGAMNAVRKQVSRIKGGRLAALAHPAKVVSLVVSDIPGDNPALVASGPTIADETTRANAMAIIEHYGLDLPDAVMRHLEDDTDEPPLPSDPHFARNEIKLVASAAIALDAAADVARKAGVETIVLSDAIEGEASEIGRQHGAIVAKILQRGLASQEPMLLLSGGETTVTIKGKGKGGRNSEFLLSFACAISGKKGISALAADTDGIDGSEDNAGAFADGTTVSRLAAREKNAAEFLERNDSWSAFAAIDDLFVTGPTGTNVNDFRAILLDPLD
ncbi:MULTISPECIES: glycerate kinase [unclassified Rhizobium]|uniref:glycerate kinase type-2 family protein n=1 Tax=unclassified Rhizobium TaxID=2613769 RepID=UPI00162112D6|nr:MULTISPECIES: glycerate kinase [unclassified Rhizobium]MBB3383898.1 hydroxypyruvate reductase [Rhizobium sp. BK098]MBB3615598.1 hydroxypyruvate reductase [Rhizobium sp. BK609]MBB3681258.1 hydroxypyruvate reductase [Rhizobium sp. BK612]